MKKINNILKKIVFAFGLLYGINLLLINMNVIIPINIYTLTITSSMGIPGLLTLFALYFIIN